MKCGDCGERAAYWCKECKQPVCEREAKLCSLFQHNWRELAAADKR